MTHMRSIRKQIFIRIHLSLIDAFFPIRN